MACMVNFSVSFLGSMLILVTHILFCCLHLSVRAVDPGQICYPCIVMLFNCFSLQWTSSVDLVPICLEN